MELLRIENLTKMIRKRKIVDSISMHVNDGEIVGFLGPNGAGKTTTIKMVMGLFSITSGSITICGHDVQTDFENAMMNVGGIIENPDLYKRLTGRQNLQYFAEMYDKDSVQNIDAIVSLVKMSDRIDDKIKTYSLGMRQRIGVAQALLHMPKLLVLDEPTNGLDPIGIKELRDLLKQLAKESGVGVLVSSHLLSEMELMCDRIYIIDNGVIIGEKEMDNLDGSKDSEIFEYAFITADNEQVFKIFSDKNFNCTQADDSIHIVMDKSRIPELIRELVALNIGIFAVNQLKRSLEEDFISMTTGTKGQIQ